MTVQLALRKYDSRAAALAIRWWTQSPYSHCELVVDGWCYSSSAMDGGVRRKKIDLDPSKWDLIPLPWASGREVVEYFNKTDHHRYGWTGLITSQLFNLNRDHDSAQFCSQWCASALGVPAPSIFSPATLGEISKFIALRLSK